MTSIFFFSLIVGGGLLAMSLLGDLFGSGGDVDFDSDFDAEFDGDLDPDFDADAGGATDFAGAFRIFTIRNLTYFLFGFGGVGSAILVLEPDTSMLVTTAAALVAGGLAAAAAMLLFGWVRATDSGGQPTEDSYIGCEARVVLPMGHGKVGRVVVVRGHREHELRALPFDAAASSPERWRDVVVIDMDGGTARVSPMEALAPAGDGPAVSEE